MSAGRHSEDELRQQWAFLDDLVERQATTLRAGAQDPDEDEVEAAAAQLEASRVHELATLRRRVRTLETEQAQLRRRLDLTEQARIAAEDARAEAEAAAAAAATATAAPSGGRLRGLWRRLTR